MSLSECLCCSEIIEVGACPRRDRKKNQTVVRGTADVGYLVYLWTEMASMRDEGNRGHFLFPWRLEGLVSQERTKRLVY